ncbi:hypothetical protein [Catalinimonas niigatensis]|uniref:hypothetical protein n=1 Tax=Catalinimonas niigatensis TaxID=1397264 RepID=UPI00266648D5|nr:hypothetical protein [Catalinimonas niigatensis]WPP51449.1 hypothetical protein PZB72_03485 [Catalinimonas niigatensis]
MRKSAAIVLLFVFFLYHLGYYGFYLALTHQLDQQWHTKVYEDDLVGEELLHASIPLSIPYQPDQSEYKPVSGKLEIDGNYYRIVRQKYVQDTLHVIYVNDTLQKELKQSVNEWLASIHQKPASDSQGFQVWKVLAKDFIIDEFWLLLEQEKLLATLTYATPSIGKYSYKVSIPSPPPKV